MKPIFICLLMLILQACLSKDSISPNEQDAITGFYSIAYYNANESFDLNNDGVAHYDLMQEIPFYFDDERLFDLEISPNEISQPTKGERLFSFFFPHANLGEMDILAQHSVAYSRCGWVQRYFMQGNEIKLYPANDTGFGKVTSIKIHQDKSLEIELLKSYYDLQTNSWKPIYISVGYTKINF